MIKVGIIGSGFGLYGLLPAFNSTPGCKVISICGKRTKRLVDYCSSINLNSIYTDWKLMLDKEKLDAIAIAVTPSTQYTIAKVAINKGLHIFAEKPLATSLLQATELFNLAIDKKIVHAVDFIFPEIEAWKKVKEFLDKKTYGDLEEIYLNWDFLSYDIKNRIASWKTNIKEGGGALSFYFSHSLYYLEYLVGKILSFKGTLIYSEDSLNGGEIGLELELVFENNVKGIVHFSCNNKKLFRHQLIFKCKETSITLENENSITGNFKIKIAQDNLKEIILPKKSLPSEDERVSLVRKIATRFINACSHRNQIIPSFKEGMRVQELIEEIRLKSSS